MEDASQLILKNSCILDQIKKILALELHQDMWIM